MHMVVVLGIAVGCQHDRKIAAGPLREMAQELALGAGLVPITRKADRGAVGQPETGDVDRLPLRMLAPAPGGSRILAPAGIAAEMIDARRAAAELVERQRLHDLTLEFVEAVGKGAAHRRGLI